MRYLLVILTAFFISNSFSQNQLPVGTHPQAIEFDHFPSRLHAFVWRNWNLVNVDRLAKVLDCTEKEVESVALSMGLEESHEVPASYKKRMYITIIRRNWHLLPYEQLLVLLDMNEEELAIALKEDDFLFHKLGRLKPECSILKYEQPLESENKAADNIRKIVQHHLGEHVNLQPEARFSFIEDLKNPTGRSYKPSDNREGLKYIYSYFGLFGDPLLNPELDPYPDGLLEKLAIRGVNGIWLHVVLNQLCPTTSQFPEFGEGSDVRLINLKKIVDRAEKYGIKVYLYMNEPRAMPNEFFTNHPEIAGVSRENTISMCTSTPIVQDWIRNSLRHVFQEVPGLGGVFTITASENFTSCASHNLQDQCPRCSQRSYNEIIAEVNKVIAEGVHSVAPDAKVLVWDWGWNGHGDGTEIIKLLPQDVWLLSVSEWAVPIKRGGIDSKIGEYSISAVGPGSRALKHWEVAQARGLKTAAKVQFNNTWELSVVPWLPTLDLVAEHAHRLTQSEIDGYMLSWSLGGYPSPNLEIAQRFSENHNLTIDEVLNDIALERYGASSVKSIRQAWEHFSTAFKEFPYDVGVVYTAPQQMGPANILHPKSTGYTATMVGFPYDDLNGWRGPYPKEVFYQQFDKMAKLWEKGLASFEEVLDKVDSSKKDVAIKDFGIAKACYLHFASVANQIKFIGLRDQFLDNPDDETRTELLQILDSEIDLAKQLYDITLLDSRIGFEATNQYYYVPHDLMEKVINAEYLKELWK